MYSEKKKTKTSEKPCCDSLSSGDLASVTGGTDDWRPNELDDGEIDWEKAGSIRQDMETPNSKPFRGGFTRVK